MTSGTETVLKLALNYNALAENDGKRVRVHACMHYDVIFSFRILMKVDDMKAVKSKIRYKLRNLIPEDKFVIDPGEKNPLYKYVAWDYKERVKKHGQIKFDVFCDFLSQLSRLVVDMAKKDYFSSAERVEMAHVMSWMLGCTEYSILTTIQMEMGYYDRIKDRYQPYQKKSLGSKIG